INDPSAVLPNEFLRTLDKLDFYEWREDYGIFRRKYCQFEKEKLKKQDKEKNKKQLLESDDLEAFKVSELNTTEHLSNQSVQVMEDAILSNAPKITQYLAQNGFKFRKFKITEGVRMRYNRGDSNRRNRMKELYPIDKSEEILALMEEYHEYAEKPKATNNY
ncbi:MAG: hypothetical protein AAGB32_04350, partial [Pseudomonadota bacterium]